MVGTPSRSGNSESGVSQSRVVRDFLIEASTVKPPSPPPALPALPPSRFSFSHHSSQARRRFATGSSTARGALRGAAACGARSTKAIDAAGSLRAGAGRSSSGWCMSAGRCTPWRGTLRRAKLARGARRLRRRPFEEARAITTRDRDTSDFDLPSARRRADHGAPVLSPSAPPRTRSITARAAARAAAHAVHARCGPVYTPSCPHTKRDMQQHV